MEKYIYKYDEKGNQIEEKVFANNDSLKPAMVNKFDLRVDNEPEFDSDEEKAEIIITNKYKKFDGTGNWLTGFTFEKKVPISLTIREIEYYKKSED